MSGVPADEKQRPEGHARRRSGARIPITEPITVLCGPRRIRGWVINLGRGGVRAALDESVDLGMQVLVFIGAEQNRGRAAEVAWVRPQQPDGTIVGIAFNEPLDDGDLPTEAAPLSTRHGAD